MSTALSPGYSRYTLALGAGFTKPCALLKLNFLTSAYNKCIGLVRKSSFSKAQGLREIGPRPAKLGWVKPGRFTRKTSWICAQVYDNQDARRRAMARQIHMHASITNFKVINS